MHLTDSAFFAFLVGLIVAAWLMLDLDIDLKDVAKDLPIPAILIGLATIILFAIESDRLSMVSGLALGIGVIVCMWCCGFMIAGIVEHIKPKH